MPEQNRIGSAEFQTASGGAHSRGGREGGGDNGGVGVDAAQNGGEPTTRYPIRFGIPTLDVLLGRLNPKAYHIDSAQDDKESPPFGIYENEAAEARGESLCLCIIGTDGTGKSVLALHLAAQYLADRKDSPCRVIYASTDLSYARAHTVWENFALGFPSTRVIDPFDFNKVRSVKKTGKAVATPEFEIVEMPPFGAEHEVVKGIIGQGPTNKVFFLDIASKTSGDDWSYLNRLVATLQPSEQPHLLIVDTVDDLELLVGERDAFGNSRDRRSRVAELIRTAAGKCHILLVASESETSKMPEEYIADVVIRVRFQRRGEYIKRVVAVEKVRGQNHIRGEHDLNIRSGIGASTGTQEHFDDPRIFRPDSLQPDPRTPGQRAAGDFKKFWENENKEMLFQSYVCVMHSLHYINNSIIRAHGPNAQGDGSEARYAKFGMQYLDEILDHPEATTSGGGIPTNEPATLIGEDGTFKSALGKAFLSRALLPEKYAVSRAGTVTEINGKPRAHGAAILITTKTLDRETLSSRIKEHLPEVPTAKIFEKDVKLKIICRRLEFHHMTSSTLFHIIKQTVRAAQRMIFRDPAIMRELRESIEYSKLTTEDKRIDTTFHDALSNGKVNGEIPRSEVVRRMVGWRIRLVIDNWTTLEEMYPEVKADPLFLLCLLFFLRREGIATLFVANEDRGFSAGFNLQENRRLRDLTAVHIFTWRTPFFGESRVAITVNPPMGRQKRFDAIRELRRLPSVNHIRPHDDRMLAVSPYFELFVGLETGDPKYVPLRICLFEAPFASESYMADVKNLFGWLLDADPGTSVISIEKAETYERLRDFSQVQGSSRFPYTLVTQIDEFWAKTGPLHFQLVDRYLKAPTARTVNPSPQCVNYVVEDPLNFFQPSVNQIEQFEKHTKKGAVREWSRLDFFTPPGYSLKQHIETHAKTIVKVPYTWDFGFLMCHRDAWEAAWYYEKKEKEKKKKEKENPIDQHKPIDEFWKSTKRPTWRQFVEACTEVAKFANQRMSAERPRGFSTFGIAPEIQETLSCLLLEIWASQLILDFPGTVDSPFKIGRDRAESKEDLSKIIGNEEEITGNENEEEKRRKEEKNRRRKEYKFSLSRALCLLHDLIPPSIIGFDHRLKTGEDPDAVPVAARVWYSSAAPYQNRPSVKDWFIPRALPGGFTTRGDWFLGIIRGSRSPRLGERAIDLLSTRRGNILRLQLGIGLPVRDNLEDAIELWTSLRNIDDWGNPTERMSYRELVRMGGPMSRGSNELKPPLQGGDLHWLWRSRIRHYDRHARVLRRWTCSMLLKIRGEWSGRTGVSLYDEITPNVRNGRIIDWFSKEIARLGEALARATINSNETG